MVSAELQHSHLVNKLSPQLYYQSYIMVFNCGFNLCRKAVLGIQRHHTPAWLPKGHLHVWERHASTEY